MSHFVFPKWTNGLIPMLGVGLLAAPLYVVGIVWFGFSPRTTDVGYQPEQPIPFSHRLHAGEMGIDCRYCHNTVEVAAKAAIPPTQTCMNCHTGIQPNKNDPQKQQWKLQPLLDSAETGEPVMWKRIHDLPDYSYFNHAAHVNRGVSCVSCHGRIDKMEVVYQQERLSMGWCLECHRDPVENLRPQDEIFNLAWKPAEGQTREGIGQMLKDLNNIQPSTDCSTCHR